MTGNISMALGNRQGLWTFVMKYNTTTLPNGLRVIHLPSASQVVYCGYEIKAALPTSRKAMRV